jgi:pilin isopeptide linkage protein/uncharacterized repeat protein (TIGR02543 family)
MLSRQFLGDVKMKGRIHKGMLLVVLCLGVMFFAMFAVTEVASADTIPQSGNLTAGTTYTLTGNINLTDTLTVPSGDVTVDLNGYTVKAAKGKSAFKVTGGNLTIKDSSAAGTGKITGNTTGPQYGGGVYLDSGNFTLESGTISGCKAQTTEFKQAKGGGVYVNDGTFTIINGVIDNCSAVGESKAKTSYGGGVYMKAGTFNMNGGRISNCKASGSKNGGNGGGVYLAGGTFSMTDGEIGENCEAQAGTSSGGYDDENNYTYNGYGGGVFVKGSFTMSGGQITKCTAYTGGGVYVDPNGSFTMSGGEISGCNANQYSSSIGGSGGGIYVDSNGTLTSPENSTAKISGCSSDKTGGGIYVKGNAAINNVNISDCTSAGGGFAADASSTCKLKKVTIDNCISTDVAGGINAAGNLTLDTVIITNCTAATNGGGLYYAASSGNVEVINTTISGCKASGDGGGIYELNAGTIHVKDSSVENCSAGNNGGGFYVNNYKATLSGEVRITGNTGKDGKTDNCFLPNSNQLNLGDGLTEDAEIGVRVKDPDHPTDLNGLKVTTDEFTTQFYQNALTHFTSDDPDYVITKYDVKNDSKHFLMIGYAIEYDLDGGHYESGSDPNPVSYNIYDTFTLTNPVREGYTFLGWTGSNGTEPQETVTVASGTRHKLSYKANWKVKQYTVRFESNGGSAVPNQTVNYNDKVVKPADPTKSGYVFKGWFKDSDLTEAYDFDTPVTGDLTLYAKWGEPEPPTPSTPTSITVNDPPVRKTISGDTPTTDETFVFSLSAQPALSTLPTGMTSMPMPGGVSEQTVTTTIVGSGSSEFGTFTFNAPGTYVYKISEIDTGAANYEYDSSEYLVTYVVTERGGNLYSTRTITKDGVVVSEAVYSFDNTYTAPASPVDPGETDEPDQPTGPHKPNVPDKPDKSDGGSDAGGSDVSVGRSVRTGDQADTGFWLAVLLAASGTAAVLIRRRRYGSR